MVSVTRIMISIIGAAILICTQNVSMAQEKKMEIVFLGGAGYAPMSEWGNRMGRSDQEYFYDKDRYGQYMDFHLVHYFSPHHAFRLSIEHIKQAASMTEMVVWASDGGIINIYSNVIDWRFSTFPIGISYEYYPGGHDKKVNPFIGIGVAYYVTAVKAQSHVLYDDRPPVDDVIIYGHKYRDRGDGFHIYTGIKSALTGNLFAETQIRWRYADGRSITDKKGDVKVMFTGIDLAAGLGLRF